MDDDRQEIERPPSKKSILSFNQSLTQTALERIARQLGEAVDKDEWPIVTSGLGSWKWINIEEGAYAHPVEKIRVYRDRANEWRWRAFAFNNRMVAESGEGYGNFDDCADMAERLFPTAKVDMRSYIGYEKVEHDGDEV